MLEQMRRQGASIFIYLIFSLLIVIFVYGLAPSSRGDGGGCRSSSTSAVTVDGQSVSNGAWLIAYQGNNAGGRQKTYVALDFLIRRELLAQAAQQAGIRANGDMVDEEIKRGFFFLGGQRIDARGMFFSDDLLDLNKVKSWTGQLSVSLNSYREEQTRGLQAAMWADMIKSSVRVSRNEALADYLYENNTVTYNTVTFDPAKYAAQMKLGEADVKRFLDGHAAEVEARFKADERTYKDVKPQIAVREIFIPKAYPQAKPADDKKSADDKKADDKKPADDKTAKADDKAKKPENPRGLPLDEAKAKLEAVRAQITAGKLKFIDAEKQLAADSSDDVPGDNGDRGWRSLDSAALGDKAVNDAVKTLKPGELTPVITTDRGAYLVTVTDTRKGDLTYDQVKTEIAGALAKDLWSKEAAKRDALAALAQVQSGKKLEDLFEKEAPKLDIEQMLNDPSVPEEQKQMIRQLMQQKQQLRQKHGALETHEVDVPVGWFADADGSSGGSSGSAAAPAAGSAAGSAAPAAGSAAPAAGSAPAPASDAAAKPAVPPSTIVEASKDTLPAFGDVAKPKLGQQGPAPRQAKMPGIGGSPAAAAALFDELAPGQAAKTVFEGEAGSYVIVQLISRNEPKVEDFDKNADAEIARMQETRGRALLQTWLKERCETLTKSGKIRPSPDHIRETDDKGNPAPTVYHPCMYFDQMGARG